MTITLGELARRIGAEVRGDGEKAVSGCAPLDAAGPDQVSFLTNRRYAARLAASRAGAVILSEQDANQPGGKAGGRTLLIAADPYFVFRQAMVVLHGWRGHPEPGVSDRAWVDPTARLGEGCVVEPLACIAADARIGRRCVLYPHCYVGPGACLGDDCVLHPGVTIYDGCVLGERVTLHAGCVIGQDGFGYATHQQPGEPVKHHKIPQAGNAVIEDDVEMGANCSVDRATLGSTLVGRGSKFSNGVTIGHGSRIGPHNLYVAQVGVAGSVRTGDYVTMGGQVGVAGHLHIGERARIAATSGVMHDVPADASFGGTPATALSNQKRVLLHTQRLPQMSATLRQLQRRIEQLEAQLAAPSETDEAG